MMEEIQIVLTVCSLFISLCTIGTLIYGFGKFLTKPRDTLEQRITYIEARQKEMNRMLEKHTERCREQDDTNEILVNSVLALIEFEIQYCLIEHKEMSKGLEKAKDDLHHYLAKK